MCEYTYRFGANATDWGPVLTQRLDALSIRPGEAHRAPREADLLQPDQPLVVSEATTDARFADKPFVTGAPHIRFYAGVPIRSSGGLVIGTLCVRRPGARAHRRRVVSASEARFRQARRQGPGLPAS
jgi:GAF domain-containing protein